MTVKLLHLDSYRSSPWKESELWGLSMPNGNATASGRTPGLILKPKLHDSMEDILVPLSWPQSPMIGKTLLL